MDIDQEAGILCMCVRLFVCYPGFNPFPEIYKVFGIYTTFMDVLVGGVVKG